MAYNKGESLTFQLKCYSDSAKTTLIDADTVKITVTDPAATSVINDQSASKTATGTYQYAKTLDTTATLGLYTYKWTATLSSKPTIVFGHFVVEE